MTKSFGTGFIILLSLAMAACAGYKDPTANPSIHAEYATQNTTATNALQSAVTETQTSGTNLTSAEYANLKTELDALKAILPTSGLVVSKTLDSFNTALDNTAISPFQTQPQILVTGFQRWVLCTQPGATAAAAQLTVGSFSATIAATAGVYTVPTLTTTTFEYVSNAPTYSQTFSTLATPGTITAPASVDSTTYNCVSRDLLSYKEYSYKSLLSIGSWQKAITEIESALAVLETETTANYPYSKKLQELANKLQAAYAQLP